MIRKIALILLFFNGVSAIFGGGNLVLDPTGDSMEMPLHILNGTPFSNFLIPGLILLLIIGFGSIAVGIASLKRIAHYPLMIMVIGIILIIWIVVQMILIQVFHWLQALYGGIGVLLIVLGWLTIKYLTYDQNSSNRQL